MVSPSWSACRWRPRRRPKTCGICGPSGKSSGTCLRTWMPRQWGLRGKEEGRDRDPRDLRRQGAPIRDRRSQVQRDRGRQAGGRCAGLLQRSRHRRGRPRGGVGSWGVRTAPAGEAAGRERPVRRRGLPGRGDPGGDDALRLRGRGGRAWDPAGGPPDGDSRSARRADDRNDGASPGPGRWKAREQGMGLGHGRDADGQRPRPASEEGVTAVIVDKPWGKVTTYALNQPSSVRMITIEPRMLEPQPGDEFVVTAEESHRIRNTGQRRGRVLEVAYGYTTEDDTFRLQDAYGRPLEPDW